jgi:Dipeptidyl aminopeptidases/acylaminoacyl-peptidases
LYKYDNSDLIIDAYKMLMGDAGQQEYDKASPLYQIKSDFPPTMWIHGSSDSVVKLEDSTDLYQKLRQENIPAELHIFSEEDHAFDSVRGYGRSVAELQNLFFKKYL